MQKTYLVDMVDGTVSLVNSGKEGRELARNNDYNP